MMYKQVSKVMPGSEVRQKAVLTVSEGRAQAYLPLAFRGAGQAISLRYLIPEPYYQLLYIK